MSDSNQNAVSRVLADLRAGRADAEGELAELVYSELREMAGQLMRAERVAHTLQPTALVNEAFIKLVASEAEWKDRAHFLGVAATAMRQILIDHARRRISSRRGGDRGRLTLTGDFTPIVVNNDLDLLSLHEALENLSALNRRQARVVEMRFFGGMTVQEVAEVLGVSKTTVDKSWRAARAWLNAQLCQDSPA